MGKGEIIRPLRVLDLFSGIGGFSLGLERTGGFETVAFCECEPYPRAVLAKHWPGVYCFDDVRTLCADGVDFAAGGSIDVICGGFPCQDISLAGKGAGLSGERSGLWREYHRIIEEIRPSWAIIETVSALRSRGLDEVLGSLAAIGYDAEWHCIPASAVGAPHQRDRIWIIAYPSDGRHGLVLQPERKPECGTASDVGSYGETWPLANADSRGQSQLRELNSGPQTRIEGAQRNDVSGCGSHVADTASRFVEPGRTWRDELGFQGSLLQACGRSDDWETEPNICRVADGVPRRVDRLRALGNAVVPAIPEAIGRAILSTYA